ncbi:hypothetical protein ACFL2Q_00980 [Thermodesulfobacteriota bacterium]
MRADLVKLLVCLFVLFAIYPTAAEPGNNFINVIVDPAGSAFDTAALMNNAHRLPATGPGTPFRQAAAGNSGPYFPEATSFETRSSRPRRSRYRAKPIQKCKVPVPPAPRWRGGLPLPAFDPLGCPPFFRSCPPPGRLCRQWEAGVHVMFASLRGKLRWPAVVNNLPATVIDFSDTLGLPRHWAIAEYFGRYQFRKNWGIYYSILPYYLEGSNVIDNGFGFGQWWFPAGAYVRSKWEFVYQRLGLVYTPIRTPKCTVSITGGWMFQDQRITILSPSVAGYGNRVDRTRNMVSSGIEIKKGLCSLPNGGVFSCDNRIELQWLDGSFGLDFQTGIELNIPMNCHRRGYLKGGWRLTFFNEDRPDLRLDTGFEGGFVEAGLVF